MSSVRTVDDESLAEARTIIGNGGLVVIPTDTVYGVACDPRNAKAIARIYEAKHRPASRRCRCCSPPSTSSTSSVSTCRRR